MSRGLGIARRSTPSIMSQVMLALIPGTLVSAYTLGPGVIINITVLVLISLCCEATVVLLRKRNVIPVLSDGSIVLAAWLMALCLPPSLPISQLVLGAVTMTVLGKHVYGGLGQNPFNPAMVGYAVLLISFPKSMTFWFDPDATMALSANGIKALPAWWELKWQPASVSTQWDSITQATPLDQLRSINRQNSAVSSTQAVSPNGPDLRTKPWFAISLAWLLGGLFLLLRGIIRWHIPFALLLAAALSHFMVEIFSPNATLPVGSALLYGGLMFGAFFIATDPVTAPSSLNARLIYGAGIGVLSVVLRTSSNYPEGVAFAVLLMNAVTPLLDRLFVLDNQP